MKAKELLKILEGVDPETRVLVTLPGSLSNPEAQFVECFDYTHASGYTWPERYVGDPVLTGKSSDPYIALVLDCDG